MRRDGAIHVIVAGRIVQFQKRVFSVNSQEGLLKKSFERCLIISFYFSQRLLQGGPGVFGGRPETSERIGNNTMDMGGLIRFENPDEFRNGGLLLGRHILQYAQCINHFDFIVSGGFQ